MANNRYDVMGIVINRYDVVVVIRYDVMVIIRYDLSNYQ